MTSPSSQVECPAMLWPPPRTASGRPWARAAAIACATSSASRGWTIRAGWRSAAPFQMRRAAS